MRLIGLAGAALALAACASDAPAASETKVADVQTTIARSTVAVTDTPTSAATTTTAPPSTAASTETATSSTTSSTTSTSTSTSTTTTTVPPAPPPPNGTVTALQLAFENVSGLGAPTAVAWRDGDDAMFVSTQDGFVHRVTADGATVVADLSGETIELLSGSERGLLGLAFDSRDGRMFVNLTDLAQNTRVYSFEMRDGVAVMDSRREILTIEQPGVGHNGGRLVFDEVGNLYIGSGDGGGSSGWDAQDTTKLLGAILRVTPRLDGPGYDIPSDNPFPDGQLDRAEVLARGFRNPWGFSIDAATGDLWVGDVGNSSREEIDVMRSGERGLNFGWPYFEGTYQRRANAPEGLIPPVFDYPRSDGIAVMGGYVYRGAAIPELRGAYLFADLGGAVWVIGADGVSRLSITTPPGIVGWGEDPDGELYLLSIYEGVFRLVSS